MEKHCPGHFYILDDSEMTRTIEQGLGRRQMIRVPIFDIGQLPARLVGVLELPADKIRPMLKPGAAADFMGHEIQSALTVTGEPQRSSMLWLEVPAEDVEAVLASPFVTRITTPTGE